MKIGDQAWLQGLHDVVAPRCDGPPLAVGLLWAQGLEAAIAEYNARRIYNATAYDSGDVGGQHQYLRSMPDSGLATHVALAVTDTSVLAFEPKYEMSMLGRVKPPSIKKDLAAWPRAGLTVTVGPVGHASVVGFAVDGRPVVLEVAVTGERHELTIGVAPHDDHFLAVLTS